MKHQIILMATSVCIIAVALVNTAKAATKMPMPEREVVSEVPAKVISIEDSSEAVVEESRASDVANPYRTVIHRMTEDEFLLLGQAIYCEAGDTSFECQVATAEVIMNRIISEDWPNDIHGVIYQTGQFSVAPYVHKATPTQTQLDVIEHLRKNGPTYLTTDYVFFCTPNSYELVGYKYMDDVFRIGGHVFGR